MDIVKGRMEALSAMQITADTEGLDAESKTLLHSKEVLAVILQGTIEEYQGYSLKVEDFMDTISEYIDFSENEELWKEAEHMSGLGQSVLEEGIEQGIEQGNRTRNRTRK